MLRMPFALRPARSVLFTLALVAGSAHAQTLDVELIETGFKSPTGVVGHPSNANMLFVLEKAGRILRTQVTSTTPGFPGLSLVPLLDIKGKVETAEEQGLLGLAFHPRYADNRRFFVKYNKLVAGGPSNLIIEEYRALPHDDVRNPDVPPITIFCAQVQEQIHMGGGLHFGRDNKLYCPTGDSSQSELSQDLTSPWGKMLRFNVNTDQGTDAPCDTDMYYVPANNPGYPNAYIWSYGLRNPYGWSFDELTSDMWIGDVGANCREEVNWTTYANSKDADYGWDLCEGDRIPFGACDMTCSQFGQTDPVWVYDHASENTIEAIIGGYVIRSSSAPLAWEGRYLFADYGRADGNLPDRPSVLQSFELSGGAAVGHLDHGPTLTTDLRGPTGFGVAANGEVFMTDAPYNAPNQGRLYRIVLM